MAIIHASIFPDKQPRIRIGSGGIYAVELVVDGVHIHLPGDPRATLRHLETEIRAAYDALDALDKQEEATK